MVFLNFRQRTAAFLPYLWLVSLVFSPVYFLGLTVLLLLGRKFLPKAISLIASIVLFGIVLLFSFMGGVKVIGTYVTVETTHKSSGAILDPGGAGTKKLIHEFKVPPDVIKELPSLTAIYYDKQHTDRIQIIKIPFIVA